MEKITVPKLLRKYRGWVRKGHIQFLKNGSAEQKDILKLLGGLIVDFDKASKGGDISENLDWYEAHEKGKKLWHALSSYALNNIDPSSKGSADLFKFLDAATEFEDLLYGLELYYRDHTLHSLWVYFIGEYLLREDLRYAYKNFNWFLYNDIERDKSQYKEGLVKKAKKRERELCNKVNSYKDAIWCIIALCHDLGYSISKLSKLNEKVEKVLGFLDLHDLQPVGYSLNIEHQYLISQFLELMAVDVRIVPSVDEQEVLIKLYRDDGTYWRLCRSLEKRQHGILSAYLIYKILGIFAEASVRGPAEEWGLEDSEVIDNLIRGDILFAMAQHEFDFAYLDELNSLADILVLSDELEEFSRYGRPMLSRKYYDTHAECSISFRKAKKDIEIDILYEVAPKHPLKEFFPRKAKRLFELYSLKKEKKTVSTSFYRIKSIKMRAEKNKRKLFFLLGRDFIRAYLPHTRIKGKEYKENEYNLIAQDDELLVATKDANISIKDWFKNATE